MPVTPKQTQVPKVPALKIEDPEAYQLASGIAEATGKSLTRVVIDALAREKDATVRPPRKIDWKKVDETLARLQEIHAGGRPVEQIMDELYDENGLPK